MLLKKRTESNELLVLRSLHPRIDFSKEEKSHHVNLEKGFQGELMFDELTEKLKSDFIIINDLGLLHSNSYYQLDSVIISQDTVYLFEIKNFLGDYIFEDDGFKTLLARKDIQNPLEQLKRSKIYFRQLLNQLGLQLPIEGFVVFINPEFTLYQSPVKAPIIFPTQLNRFMSKFDEKPSKLNQGHRKIAEELVLLHQPKSPNEQLPAYSYVQMKKGVICPKCNCFILSPGARKSRCDSCGYVVDNEVLIIMHVKELMLLFPNMKITTSIVFDWINASYSRRQVARVLKENFQLKGAYKSSFFE